MATMREILGPKTAQQLEELGKDVDFMRDCEKRWEEEGGFDGLLRQIRSESNLKVPRIRSGSSRVLAQIAAKRRYLLAQEGKK